MNLTRVCGGHKNMCSIDCISNTECFDNVCGGRMKMMCFVFVDLNSEIDHEIFDLSDRKTYSGTLSNQNSWRGYVVYRNTWAPIICFPPGTSATTRMTFDQEKINETNSFRAPHNTRHTALAPYCTVQYDCTAQ